MNSIFVIGCGNIGRRHLQALQAAERDLELIVIEPDAAARAAAMNLLPSTPRIQMAAFAKITDAPRTHADLAIISTTAQRRREAIEALLAHSPPQKFLLEKILFTTRRDLDEMEEKLGRFAIPTWVNCGRRGFPLYDQLRRQLQGKRATVEIQGSRWGLCCNGIHFLDIAGYVLGDFLECLSGEELEEQPEPAKRPGFMELYGTLRGRFSCGSSLTLRCFRENGIPMTLSFSDGLERWVVDETNACLTHWDKNGRKTSEPFAMLRVSSMDYLYSEILDTGSSRLTPYALSASQHRLFLNVVRQRLGLSNERDEPCPIT